MKHCYVDARPKCARRSLPCLLLLFLLAPAVVSAFCTPPAITIPPGVSDLAPPAGAPPVALANEPVQRSLGLLIGAFEQCFFLLGAALLLMQFWRVCPGEADSLLPALGGPVALALALTARAVLAVMSRCWLGLGVFGILILSPAAASAAMAVSSGLGQWVKTRGLGLVVLAQAAAEPSMDPIISFLGKVMLCVGGVMIFAGGWRVHKGENSEGLLAIVGGFIVAMAFPIIRYFFNHS